MKIFLPVVLLLCINAFSLQAKAATPACLISVAIDTSVTGSSENIQKGISMYNISNVNNENMFSTREYSSHLSYNQIAEQTSDYGDHPYLVSDLLIVGVVAVILYMLLASLSKHS